MVPCVLCSTVSLPLSLCSAPLRSTCTFVCLTCRGAGLLSFTREGCGKPRRAPTSSIADATRRSTVATTPTPTILRKNRKKGRGKETKEGFFVRVRTPFPTGGSPRWTGNETGGEFLLGGGIVREKGGRCAAGRLDTRMDWNAMEWVAIAPRRPSSRWKRRRGNGNDALPMHLKVTQDQGRKANVHGGVRTHPHETRPTAAAAGARHVDDLGWKPTHTLSMHGKRSTHRFMHHTRPKILAC